MADYFSQEDLEGALSSNIVEAAYDDDHSGAADAAAIALCISYGNTMVNSFLRNLLAGVTLPLSTVPDEVKFAAIDFGIAFTVRRRPELMKALGVDSYKAFEESALEHIRRYCASEQRVPSTTGTHATAGGALLNPNSDEDGNEECLPDESRWTDMGLFS